MTLSLLAMSSADLRRLLLALAHVTDARDALGETALVSLTSGPSGGLRFEIWTPGAEAAGEPLPKPQVPPADALPLPDTSALDPAPAPPEAPVALVTHPETLGSGSDLVDAAEAETAVTSTSRQHCGPGPRWTEEEVARLCELRREGRTQPEIAKALGRPATAISMKIIWLKKQGVDVPDRASTRPQVKVAPPRTGRWNDEDDAALLRALAEGRTTQEAATELGRKPNGVKFRIQKLRARGVQVGPQVDEPAFTPETIALTEAAPAVDAPGRAVDGTASISQLVAPAPEAAKPAKIIPKLCAETAKEPRPSALPAVRPQPRRVANAPEPTVLTVLREARAADRPVLSEPHHRDAGSKAPPREAGLSLRREIARHLDTVGHPSTWTPQRDLALVDGLIVRGGSALPMIARELGVTGEEALARFRRLTATIRSERGPCTIEGQEALVAELKVRAAETMEIAAQ